MLSYAEGKPSRSYRTADGLLTVADGVQVAERLGTKYRTTPFFVEFHAEGYRCVLFQNGRLLIHGLKDMKEGRKLYHQFFG